MFFICNFITGGIQNGKQPGYALQRFDKFYSEYYTQGSYNVLSMKVAPYIYTGENSKAYIEVYADDVLVYTSPTITRKTQPFVCEVDIEDAQYINIVANVYTGSGGTTTAIILSEMKIWTES